MPRIMVKISKRLSKIGFRYNWLKRLTVTRGGAFRQFHKYDVCRFICRLQWSVLVWLFLNYWKVRQPFLCYVCWCLFSDSARQTGFRVIRIFSLLNQQQLSDFFQDCNHFVKRGLIVFFWILNFHWWMENLIGGWKADIPAACSLPPHESWGLQWAQAKVFLIHPPEAPPLLDSN